MERRALAAGFAIGALIATFVSTFNVLTRVHDWPEQGVLAPVILEGSSIPFVLLAMPLPAVAALWMFRRRPGLWRAAQANIAAGVLFFLAHVGGFTFLRMIAFPLLLHEAYRIGSLTRDPPYEFTKDLLAYGVSVAGFRVLLGWSVRLEPEQVASGVFDIRDGQRLVRAALIDILAVRSAGNYVEFLLVDGRRPLMRKPLAAVEAELGPLGFVRTHRSWLVNAGRVTGLRPEGSGDYAVEIGKLEAPLSRRFPEALAALRG